MTSRRAAAPTLDDLALLRRVRDRMDREHAQPLEVEALARGVHMRWITIGPPGQTDTSVVLTPPAADPGITDDERRTISEMMAKGTYASIMLGTPDLDGTFEKIQAGDVEIVQEPTEQDWRARDCAVRDPAGNMVRIQEIR